MISLPNTDGAAHLGHIADRLASEPALARFASRLSVTRSDQEIVVGFAGRTLSVRVVAGGIVVGNDEIALGGSPRETLTRVANRLVFRLGQMDG